MSDYYELFQQIQKKPALYIGTPLISSLYMFLNGYQFARRQLRIPITPQEEEFRDFQPWLQEKFGIKSSQSWSQMILSHSLDERDAFEHFFQLVQEYLSCKHTQVHSNHVIQALELA